MRTTESTILNSPKPAEYNVTCYQVLGHYLLVKWSEIERQASIAIRGIHQILCVKSHQSDQVKRETKNYKNLENSRENLISRWSVQNKKCWKDKTLHKIQHTPGVAGWNCLLFMASIILVLCSFNEQTMLSTQSGTLSMPKHTRHASQTLHTVDGTSLLPPRVEKEVFEFNKEKPRQHLHCLKETRPRD